MINYIEHVENSIESAMDGKTKLDGRTLGIQGMSSNKVRIFLNELLTLPDAKYLEIGVWKGSTLCSALFGNSPTYAVGIDNWSEMGGPKDAFRQISGGLGLKFEFYDGDCFALDKANFKHKFNIYLYDGRHEEIDQERALTHFFDCLEDEFIFICDDYNWQGVKDGTKKGFDKIPATIIKSWELPSVGNGDTNNWWNGVLVAYCKKK